MFRCVGNGNLPTILTKALFNFFAFLCSDLLRTSESFAFKFAFFSILALQLWLPRPYACPSSTYPLRRKPAFLPMVIKLTCLQCLQAVEQCWACKDNWNIALPPSVMITCLLLSFLQQKLQSFLVLQNVQKFVTQEALILIFCTVHCAVTAKPCREGS